MKPEDSEFQLRRWADFDFLIVALTRLRRAANIAKKVQQISPQISAAVSAFDSALPHLKRLRDIAEHIDEYAVDAPRRHDQSIIRQHLEVGELHEETFVWLRHTLSITDAPTASKDLFQAIRKASSAFARDS